MFLLKEAGLALDFLVKEVGLALDSRECVILSKPRRGSDLEELRYPALAQVRGAEIRSVGQRAHCLVGKSRDVVTVFPGRVEDATILGDYLRRVVPRHSMLKTRRLWASVPTGTGFQALHNLRQCFEGSLGPTETILVPELLAAAVGCGFPVLRLEDDSHKAKMVIHLGVSRMSAGVFVDGSLTGLVVKVGSWDLLTRELQETLQFRLGTALGHNTLFKVVRCLSRSFFERKSQSSAVNDTPAATHQASPLAKLDPVAPAEIAPPANLRSFSERGLIEYVVEDETVTRAIDLQLETLLFNLEKVVFGSFAKLRSEGRGEIASDLFSDRVMLCGDVFFDPAALSQYFTRLSRFRFESTNGHAVARGLRKIMASERAHKRAYRELSNTIHDEGRFLTCTI
jgi:hypothetical protein